MFRPMRLTRQQLSNEETIGILEKCGVGTLALKGDDEYPYSVPVNYIYIDGSIYFHGAKSGHKVDAIDKCAKASMSIIAKNQLVAEKYTTDYKSVIVFGQIYKMTDEMKMREIIKAFAEKFCSEYSEGIDAEIEREWKILNMYEMKIEYMTGKKAMF